jgi:hypothetical protein
VARPSLYVFSERVMCKITRHQTGTHSLFEMVTQRGGLAARGHSRSSPTGSG